VDATLDVAPQIAEGGKRLFRAIRLELEIRAQSFAELTDRFELCRRIGVALYGCPELLGRALVELAISE
jgi:hypothetical protein